MNGILQQFQSIPPTPSIQYLYLAFPSAIVLLNTITNPYYNIKSNKCTNHWILVMLGNKRYFITASLKTYRSHQSKSFQRGFASWKGRIKKQRIMKFAIQGQRKMNGHRNYLPMSLIQPHNSTLNYRWKTYFNGHVDVIQNWGHVAVK